MKSKEIKEKEEKEEDSSRSITSHIISSYKKIFLTLFFCFFFLFFSNLQYFSILPFIIFCIKGIHSSILSGLLLSIIWGTVLCLVFSPLALISIKFLFISLYSPLLFILIKNMKKKPSKLIIIIQYILYEIPIISWMYLLQFFNIRALEPFYTQITNSIAISSLPFPSDVKYLKSKNVCGVINMCLEYSGPIKEYEKYEIKQLHLPTLDIHEPTLNDMKKAIDFIEDIISSMTTSTSSIDSNEIKQTNPIILIHCKGGRGRAVTTCLCYFISKGYSISDGFNLIKSCRDVASEAVMYSSVVKSFEKYIQNLKEVKND